MTDNKPDWKTFMKSRWTQVLVFATGTGMLFFSHIRYLGAFLVLFSAIELVKGVK